MIKDFKCKYTEKLYAGQHVKTFSGFDRQARRRLRVLDDAENLDQLRGLPSNRLEPLQGNRKGQYSIRINNQWRICFVWKNDEACEVEIIDYH